MLSLLSLFAGKKGQTGRHFKMVLVQSLASRNWNGPSFKMCYRQDLTKMCHCVCVLYPSELRLYDDSLHSEYHYYISAKKWSFARARRTWLDLLGQRDHPFKTSAKFHDFWPLPPTVGSFLLLKVRWSQNVFMKSLIFQNKNTTKKIW